MSAADRPQLRWLLPGFVAVALVCRTPITSVPPALATIRADLGLRPTVAGLTTTLPLLCFGIFAFATPYLVARWGTERTTAGAVLVTLAGILLRSLGHVVPFFAGTALVGIGIAVVNVVLPAIVRERWPGEVPRRMSLYTVAMILGASVASALTAPLLAHGLGWQLATGLWAPATVVALVLWSLAAREIHSRHSDAVPARPTGMGHVVRRGRTWWTALFMGTQSLCFYVLLTWLPDLVRAHGATMGQAGLLLAVYMAMGIPGSFYGPRMATAPRALGIFFGAYALAVLALLGPLWLEVIAVVVTGFGQGAGIAVALTFIARQDDARDVPAVSAFAQGIGFLVAATGPVVAGALLELTHDWPVPVLTLLAVNLVQAGSGLVLAYPGRR